MLEAIRNDQTESVTVCLCNAYRRPASELVVDRRFTLVYTEVATELGFFTAAFSRCDKFASEDESFAGRNMAHDMDVRLMRGLHEAVIKGNE